MVENYQAMSTIKPSLAICRIRAPFCRFCQSYKFISVDIKGLYLMFDFLWDEASNAR